MRYKDSRGTDRRLARPRHYNAPSPRQRSDNPTSFERFGRAVDLYALPMRTGFSPTRIYMRLRPRVCCGSDRTLGLPPNAIGGDHQQKPWKESPRSTKRNTSVTSLILSPALSTFARAAGKSAGQGMRRTLTVVSMFFTAIVEARAMMARRQAIGSAAGAASDDRRHD
jgi:hypothetical protein